MSDDNDTGEQINFFPPEMAKYGLTFDFTKLNDSFVELVGKCWEIDKAIKAASESKSDSVKVATHPYDVKAKRDKKAEVISADLIKAFVAACDAAISKNKNVAWHLAESDSAVTAYLTSEMQYYRIKESPAKPAIAGTALDTLRNDRKVLTKLAQMLLNGQPLLSNDKRFTAEMKEAGKVKLPNLQGAGTKASDSPTGRNAGFRNGTWTIDGVTFPINTESRDLIRAIWSGVDRVGKSAKDVYNPIDDKVKKDNLTFAQRNEGVTITLNGKEVTFKSAKAKA